jgi:hypothetical protein
MSLGFSSRRLACAVLTITFVAGCGNKVAPPPLGEVTGTVTMDGAPLKNVDVVFTADKSRPSYGRTDDAGKYALTFNGSEKGAVVGKHSVSISTPVEHPPGPTYKDPVPAKYNTATELTADVKAGPQVINFDLKSK